MFRKFMNRTIVAFALVMGIALGGPAHVDAQPVGSKPAIKPAINNPVTSESTTYVLSIAIETDANGHPLTGARQNAEKFNEAFKDQDGPGHKVEVLPLLLNSRATSEAIRKQLAELKDKLRPGDTVVILMAGHGVDPKGEGSESKWWFNAYDYSVSEDDLREDILALAKAGAKVNLFLDSCHSGAFKVDHPNVNIMAACGAEQTAIYLSSNDDTGEGLFTSAVVEALRAGMGTPLELYAYVSDRLAKRFEELKSDVHVKDPKGLFSKPHVPVFDVHCNSPLVDEGSVDPFEKLR